MDIYSVFFVDFWLAVLVVFWLAVISRLYKKSRGFEQLGEPREHLIGQRSPKTMRDIAQYAEMFKQLIINAALRNAAKEHPKNHNAVWWWGKAHEEFSEARSAYPRDSWEDFSREAGDLGLCLVVLLMIGPESEARAGLPYEGPEYPEDYLKSVIEENLRIGARLWAPGTYDMHPDNRSKGQC